MLNVSEIFHSIQGETSRCGFPSVFIRLAGCNLNCSQCDTPLARTGGSPMKTAEVIGRAAGYPGADHVTITGGEPLLQEGVLGLMDGLLEAGWSVQLETNGSLGLEGIKSGVRKIVDVKTPSTGECGSFLMENIRLMGEGDEIKFLIADDGDYGFSTDFVKRHLHGTPALINFSPVHGVMDPGRLAGMMLGEGIRARLNIQIHKYINVE